MAKYIPIGWKDYSADGWASVESNYDAASLLLSMQNIASKLGIETSVLNASNPYMVGWDKILKFEGVRIEFQNQDYGCSLRVVMIDEKIISKGFFVIWKYYIDKGIISGGPYRKVIAVESQEINPQNIEEKNMTEDEWPKRWIEYVCSAKMKDLSRRQYIFLFAVLQNGAEITQDSINHRLGKTFAQIDEMAGSGETFQKLAEDYFISEYQKDRPKGTQEAVRDIKGLNANLYNNFYLSRRKEFEFPNFPKP